MPKRRYTDTIDAVQLNVGLVIEHEGVVFVWSTRSVWPMI